MTFVRTVDLGFFSNSTACFRDDEVYLVTVTHGGIVEAVNRTLYSGNIDSTAIGHEVYRHIASAMCFHRPH
eukprot:2916403-Amphidinium_carterae.1